MGGGRTCEGNAVYSLLSAALPATIAPAAPPA